MYELGPDCARKVLDDIQAAPGSKLYVEDTCITVPAEAGDVPVRILKPGGAAEVLPVVLYVHGGGWILGNAGTHDRLVRELAVGTNAALVFVEYDRSPEAQYPVAIEQAYPTAQWIVQHGDTQGLDGTRLAVAGDSVGGNLATALAILAKQRSDVIFLHQSLYYPVTDAAQDTGSYREFANGPPQGARNQVTAAGRTSGRYPVQKPQAKETTMPEQTPNAITRRTADTVQAQELMSRNDPAGSAPGTAGSRAGSPADR